MRRAVGTGFGAVMLSSVLRNEVAALASIEVVRAFVRMRRFLRDHRELAVKLSELQQTVGGHDQEIRAIFDAIRRLLLHLLSALGTEPVGEGGDLVISHDSLALGSSRTGAADSPLSRT